MSSIGGVPVHQEALESKLLWFLTAHTSTPEAEGGEGLTV